MEMLILSARIPVNHLGHSLGCSLGTPCFGVYSGSPTTSTLLKPVVSSWASSFLPETPFPLGSWDNTHVSFFSDLLPLLLQLLCSVLFTSVASKCYQKA